MLAGALVTELNKEGTREVAFYHRKGGDILDKWVGESERKLKELFTQVNRLFYEIVVMSDHVFVQSIIAGF